MGEGLTLLVVGCSFVIVLSRVHRFLAGGLPARGLFEANEGARWFSVDFGVTVVTKCNSRSRYFDEKARVVSRNQTVSPVRRRPMRKSAMSEDGLKRVNGTRRVRVNLAARMASIAESGVVVCTVVWTAEGGRRVCRFVCQIDFAEMI